MQEIHERLQSARPHNIIAQWESENESPLRARTCLSLTRSFSSEGGKECACNIIEPKQMVERRVAACNDLDLLNEIYVNLSFYKIDAYLNLVFIFC